MTETKPTLEYARPRPRWHWTWRDLLDELLPLAGTLIGFALLLGAARFFGVTFN